MSSLPVNPPDSAPQDLRDLWPLVRRFGRSDDRERGQVLDTAPSDELARLVQEVGASALRSINAYLDAAGDSEEAVPFGDLAQAAMEATSILRERGEGP